MTSPPRAAPTWQRRPLDALAVLLGGGVLALGMAVVGRDGHLPSWERDLFELVNEAPDVLYVVAWPVQQLGVLAVGPLLALVALLTRRYRLAAALLVATVAKLVTERLVKDVVSRDRPASSIGESVELRGHVPTVGESFVSGHAVLVTAIAGLVSPYLAGRLKAVPWVVAAGVCVGRVYVGAHNPLDVVCGAGLGLVIAGCLNLAFGVPAVEGQPRRAPAPRPAPEAPEG